jgi:hypothetical protein
MLAAAALAASAGCGDGAVAPTCSAAHGCASGEWCLYPDALCGKGMGSGTCTPISELTCEATQVCGCDGNIYPTVCAAARAGVDTTDATSCPVPAGEVTCGGTYCRGAAELCSVTKSFVAATSVCQTSVVCAPLPSACAAQPSCACLSANGFPGTCTGDATNGFTVTAPAGC